MDWRTWSPFQSKIVKEICEHMTKDEKKAIASYGATFGVIAAVFFAIPLSFGFAVLGKETFGLPGAILLAWMIIGIFVMLRRRRKGKELLCATEWAKSQGLTPDKL